MPNRLATSSTRRSNFAGSTWLIVGFVIDAPLLPSILALTGARFHTTWRIGALVRASNWTWAGALVLQMLRLYGGDDYVPAAGCGRGHPTRHAFAFVRATRARSA